MLVEDNSQDRLHDGKKKEIEGDDGNDGSDQTPQIETHPRLRKDEFGKIEHVGDGAPCQLGKKQNDRENVGKKRKRQD
jgi:hypothetical protein